MNHNMLSSHLVTPGFIKWQMIKIIQSVGTEHEVFNLLHDEKPTVWIQWNFSHHFFHVKHVSVKKKLYSHKKRFLDLHVDIVSKAGLNVQ